MYDVVVVGARVAGSATGMLLARKGLRVLVVDRATFPSDTLSTHQVQLPGVALLHEWGLLDRIAAAGTPATRRVTFDAGRTVLRGSYPAWRGVDALYSPRRTLLDRVLVDAAREAGAEVREGFAVDEILVEEGRVTGIRGRDAGGATAVERAAIVVGADGKHSAVARAAGAHASVEKPNLSFAYYTYWAGVPAEGGEMYARPGRAVGAWPTNDGLVMTYVAGPRDDFPDFRTDIEAAMLAALDACGDLGQRVRAGRRAERFYGTSELPNRVRVPFGPGWALAGDAGFVMDPVTGQGIGNALADAQMLADALGDGLGGTRLLDQALAGYREARDRSRLPMLEFTTDLAAFRPPSVEQTVLFESLAASPRETDRFFGVLTGTESLSGYFTPGNLRSVIGLRGFARIALGKLHAA